jgi:hypothetical protein
MEVTAVVEHDQNTAGVSTEVSESRVAAPTDVMAMLGRALEQGHSVETIERLVALRERMKAEWAREQFFAALSEFQAEVPAVAKTKTVMNKDGRTVRYKYAPLDAIVEPVKPALRDHGFSYTIKPVQDEPGQLTAVVIAHHKDGHGEETRFTVPIDTDSYMTSPQRVGSARTFAMRYAFCNAFGILTGDADDDANSADNAEVTADKAAPYIARQDKCETLEELRELMQQLWKSELPVSSPLRAPVKAHFEELKQGFLDAEVVHGEVVYD